ncbi:hypothetical protein ACVWZ4_001192 [Bradyrhizobium sp. USDA 4472]
MSQVEVERFVNNLAKEGSLLESLKQSATGLAPIVAAGRSRGYDFTLDEVRSCIRSPRRLESMHRGALVGSKQDSSGAGLSEIVHTTALTRSNSQVRTATIQTADGGRNLVAMVLLIVVVVAVTV